MITLEQLENEIDNFLKAFGLTRKDSSKVEIRMNMRGLVLSYSDQTGHLEIAHECSVSS